MTPHRRWPRLLAVVLALGAAAACTTPPPARMSAPAGFAVFAESADAATLLTAVSAEGMSLRLRSVANAPRQTLTFWSEALQTHLLRSGYTLLDQQALDSRVGTVQVLRWVAPVGNADWVYLTALAVLGERILLVEAAGEAKVYAGYQAAVLASLASLAATGQ